MTAATACLLGLAQAEGAPEQTLAQTRPSAASTTRWT